MNGLREAGHSPVTPFAATEIAQSLLTATTCAASGAWTYTGIVDVAEAREITLFVSVNATTGASAAIGIKPLISAEGNPAAGDDSWFGLVHVDSVAPTDLSGTVPTGADWTLSPESAVQVARDLVIKTELSNLTTDEYRLALTFDVSGARKIIFAYAEIGATAKPSIVTMKYSRHA